MNVREIILGQRTFFFAVTKSPLAIIDPDPPQCTSKYLCSTIGEQCLSGQDCEMNEWRAEVAVRDSITGLRGVTNQNDIIDDDLIIGSVDNVTIRVSGSCCKQVVDLNITDVAGNWKICRASINAARKVTAFNYLMAAVLMIIH